MTNSIVIVESPAKVGTLEKYLGKGFKVLASYGHVRDLLAKDGAVDTKNHFAMHYEPIERNAKHIEAIAKAMKKADNLYLATDPDREGEAISWHVYELLKARDLLKDKHVSRVVFHEITKSAVKQAFEHPRELNLHLVDAQQARRALDFLVGFNLSPLLWRKVQRGLSAGRVQSPALRMIAEREDEIEKFKPQEYWSVEADCEAKKQAFVAKLAEYAGEKLEQFTLTNAAQTEDVKAVLEKAAQGFLLVSKVEKKQRKRNPSPPFTTSTLQQEASRKLGFGAKRTMMVAQQLYEGIDINGEHAGLITYMRTDSLTLSQEALSQIREFIAEKYGKENLPDEERHYKAKSKNAQEAHEAIRPTHIQWTPDSLKDLLTPEQFKLYDLIWKRTVACQMIHATIDAVAVDLMCGKDNRFRANGSTIANPGFIMVYQEGVDDTPIDNDDKLLPLMKEGEKIPLNAIRAEQHFTEPPPRYSEASLVKALEEYGIGRPSTYASIISTLQDRKYVELDQKRFYPTDMGRVVNKFLTEYFTQYVDYDFTAKLEDKLDDVANGETEWIPLLEHFWQPFKGKIDDVMENVKRSDVTQELLDEKCPKCEKQLSTRLGKRGRFVGCTGYPECDFTRNIDGTNEDAKADEEIIADRKCPDCQGDLVIKWGRYGKFIGCKSYPNCKHIEPINKPKDTEIPCPTCNQGTMMERRSRFGKIFYSCSRYPDCKYAIWNLPIAEPCPKCQWPLLMIKTTKRHGTQKVCPQEGCGFAQTVESVE